MKPWAEALWSKFPALVVLAFLIQPLPTLGQVARPTAVSTHALCARLFLGDQGARPDNPAYRINRTVIDHVNDRLTDNNKTATAGMESSKELKKVVPRAGVRFRPKYSIAKTERRIANSKTSGRGGANQGHL